MMRKIALTVAAILCIFAFAPISVSAAPEDADHYKLLHEATSDEVTRDHIMRNIERRKGQLEVMLQETLKKLEEHDSGRELLESEEHETMKKRAEIVKEKLARMEEYDEREIERMRQREERRRDRRRLHREL